MEHKVFRPSWPEGWTLGSAAAYIDDLFTPIQRRLECSEALVPGSVPLVGQLQEIVYSDPLTREQWGPLKRRPASAEGSFRLGSGALTRRLARSAGSASRSFHRGCPRPPTSSLGARTAASMIKRRSAFGDLTRGSSVLPRRQLRDACGRELDAVVGPATSQASRPRCHRWDGVSDTSRWAFRLDVSIRRLLSSHASSCPRDSRASAHLHAELLGPFVLSARTFDRATEIVEIPHIEWACVGHRPTRRMSAPRVVSISVSDHCLCLGFFGIGGDLRLPRGPPGAREIPNSLPNLPLYSRLSSCSLWSSRPLSTMS